MRSSMLPRRLSTCPKIQTPSAATHLLLALAKVKVSSRLCTLHLFHPRRLPHCRRSRSMRSRWHWKTVPGWGICWGICRRPCPTAPHHKHTICGCRRRTIGWNKLTLPLPLPPTPSLQRATPLRSHRHPTPLRSHRHPTPPRSHHCPTPPHSHRHPTPPRSNRLPARLFSHRPLTMPLRTSLHCTSLHRLSFIHNNIHLRTIPPFRRSHLPS
jgi:hypothetical protein